MNGTNRQSRRRLAVCGYYLRAPNLNAIDRRNGVAVVNGERFQLFCPDDEIAARFGVQFIPLEDEPEDEPEEDEIFDGVDPRDNPDLPGWGTVVQWSDLHHFTYQFDGED